MVTTKQMAEKVVELYWVHCTPYYDADGSASEDHRVLHQSTGGRR